MTDTEIVEFVSAALRDGGGDWPTMVRDTDVDRILGHVDIHGIASLLHARLGECETLPRAVRHGLRDRAIGWAMRELGEREALGRLIPALIDQGVRPLLFKGTALAYSHYPDPALRQRADTDILVGADERAAAQNVLSDLGWRRDTKMDAEISGGEAPYRLDGPGGGVFYVDLHWRISNSAVLGPLFEHEGLWRRSMALPTLHAAARAPNPVDALLIACMHRLVHLLAPYYVDGIARFVPDRLIWLYDIRLLANAFSAEEWDQFTGDAREKGLADACRKGLLLARAQLGAPCPEPVLKALDCPNALQIADTYLRASWIRREWLDIRATPGIFGKSRFLVERLFPPADYMRQRYGHAVEGWLPWLYLYRAAGGIAKRLRNGRATAGPR